MGYDECLMAAGATVLAYDEAGSASGEWVALTPEGFYSGSYGTCSYCDEREAQQIEHRRNMNAKEIDAMIGRDLLRAGPATIATVRAEWSGDACRLAEKMWAEYGDK